MTMLESLFMSKNQKMVKSWENEHKEIGTLAGKILQSYEEHDIEKTKKYLHDLDSLTVGHLMKEDIAFYNLLKHADEIDAKTVENIKDFRNTFKGTKTALMGFISKYAAPQTELNDEFVSAFKSLVQVVVNRIKYEEKNLYQTLADSKV